MTKELSDFFATIPADKRKEVFDCLVKATDEKDLLAKMKEVGVVVVEDKVKELFEKLKDTSNMSAEELTKITGGTYFCDAKFAL